MKFHSIGRLLSLSAMAAGVLPALLWFSGTAQATTGPCRTDPLIFLSDGTSLQINATINLDPSQLVKVRYHVNVPPGVKITQVVYTGQGIVETVSASYTNLPDHYATTTTAVTPVQGAGVSASLHAVYQGGAMPDSRSKSGVTNYGVWMGVNSNS